MRISLLYIGVIGISWFYLRWYTDHGKFVSVPDMKGMKLEEAVISLEDRELHYMVIDSLYDRKAKPGTIVDQSPVAESQVKEGRQVFLTIYRYLPPMEKLGIKAGDFAAVAMIKLRNKGIEFDTLYEANNIFPGSIIRVTQSGKSIKPESLVASGSKVTLVIGRTADSKVIVPDLQGLTCAEAELMLDAINLSCNCLFQPEIVSPSTQDSSTYHVCKQNPIHDPEIGTFAGRTVDLWLYSTPCADDANQVPR